MTTTWENLPKNGGDNETIEQAITRLISAHEEDPTAHMGEGESIDEHRKEGVLDHPAGAIVPDKISFNDLQFQTRYENLSQYITSGTFSNTQWPGLSFDLYNPGAVLRTIRANVIGIINTGDLTHDLLFDTYLMRDTTGDSWTLGGGIYNTTLSTLYIGFRIVNGSVRLVYRSGGVEYETAGLFSVSQGNVLLIRVFYNSVENKLYLYINGSEIHSLTPVGVIQLSNQLGYRGDANSEEGGAFRIYQTVLSRSIN